MLIFELQSCVDVNYCTQLGVMIIITEPWSSESLLTYLLLTEPWSSEGDYLLSPAHTHWTE